MNEITFVHNGKTINLTEEDVYHLWEIVVELIGEEV